MKFVGRLFIIFLILMLNMSFAHAANFTVNQAIDNGLGNTTGTFSWAINQVNASADPVNTINFIPLIGGGNVITLQNNLPPLTNNNVVNINGVGVPNLIIWGPNYSFNVQRGTINVSALTLGVGSINNPAPNQATLTLPSSFLLSFQSINNGAELVANVKSVSSVNTIPTFSGVSSTLDSLIAAGNINSLPMVFGALYAQSTLGSLQQFLSQLVPDDVNGGVTRGSIMGKTLMHQKIFARTATLRSAYAAGDMEAGMGSYGPMIFGNTAKQQARNGVFGYTTTTAGVGYLADAPVSRFLRIGGAMSYAGTSVKRDDSTGSNTSIMSFQGAFYTSSNYGPLFLDSLISLAYNNYQGKRNIVAISQTATSKYQGTQYGCKVMGGFSLPFYGVEASPLASLQVLRLNQGSYTEKGATSANLSVSSRQTTASEVGLGVKIAETSQADDFLPEVHVLYIQDVKIPSLQVTSTFTGGGGAFIATGPTPPRSGVNVGGSITSLLSENFLIMGSYDLESRKSYTSHSASLKFKYLF